MDIAHRIATIFAAAAVLFCFGLASAQSPGECSGGACGTPMTSGGGGGGGCGCGGGSILIANTDLGDTYQYADDADDDGWEDDGDNCARVANTGQEDSDGDAVGDACDLCPNQSDAQQLDTDGDGLGDACDADDDSDGVTDSQDNCPLMANPGQKDSDSDSAGNACDTDDDNDKVPDIQDNCPLVANPGQENNDGNIAGNACDEDADKDNIMDSKDNCPNTPNLEQLDADLDGTGDACDGDIDGDSVANVIDNCDSVPNVGQADDDRDSKGNACDERFCYVVDGDQKNCLDRSSLFRVYSPSVQVKTGESFRLRLFANRTNTAMRYVWTVKERPAGSSATVYSPTGAVRLSSPFEYFYEKDSVAQFTADEPGTYKINVSGELVFPDQVNANFPKNHSYVMTVTADGDSASGCAVDGGSASGAGFGLLLLAGLFLLRRRGG